MATIRELGEKKKLIGSINKITKAMQLVAISKSKKSLAALIKYRSYYKEMISLVSKTTGKDDSKKEFKGTFWIIFLSDLGLAGGYNSNIVKLTHRSIKKEDVLYVIGNKGENLRNVNSTEKYFISSDKAVSNLSEITEVILDYYFNKNYEIKAIYTRYVSQLEFRPEIRSIIPIDIKDDEEIVNKASSSEIEFEPSKEELFLDIIETYVQSVLIGFYRESKTSENTSRRIAMENASNNGEDMLRELSIMYNRARQSKITQEISEIIGGSEALK